MEVSQKLNTHKYQTKQTSLIGCSVSPTRRTRSGAFRTQRAVKARAWSPSRTDRSPPLLLLHLLQQLQGGCVLWFKSEQLVQVFNAGFDLLQENTKAEPLIFLIARDNSPSATPEVGPESRQMDSKRPVSTRGAPHLHLPAGLSPPVERFDVAGVNHQSLVAVADGVPVLFNRQVAQSPAHTHTPGRVEGGACGGGASSPAGVLPHLLV